jgi:hypothetical protein
MLLHPLLLFALSSRVAHLVIYYSLHFCVLYDDDDDDDDDDADYDDERDNIMII